MNWPLLKTYLTVGIITKWQVDWQRSSNLERSIVEDLGVDTEDPLHFAIEASQIGSQSMKDNSNGTICCADHPDPILDVVVFRRLTLLPSMLY